MTTSPPVNQSLSQGQTPGLCPCLPPSRGRTAALALLPHLTPPTLSLPLRTLLCVCGRPCPHCPLLSQDKLSLGYINTLHVAKMVLCVFQLIEVLAVCLDIPTPLPPEKAGPGGRQHGGPPSLGPRSVVAPRRSAAVLWPGGRGRCDNGAHSSFFPPWSFVVMTRPPLTSEIPPVLSAPRTWSVWGLCPSHLPFTLSLTLHLQPAGVRTPVPSLSASCQGGLLETAPPFPETAALLGARGREETLAGRAGLLRLLRRLLLERRPTPSAL